MGMLDVTAAGNSATEGQCKWARLSPSWIKRFLVDPSGVAHGSWLTSKWTKGLGVGCKCCRAAGWRSPFGAYHVKTTAALQPANFAKRAPNPKHQVVVAAYKRNASAEVALTSPSL